MTLVMSFEASDMWVQTHELQEEFDSAWNNDPVLRTPPGEYEREQCPHCHEWFYAPKFHDPLRKHLEYCPRRPENIEGDDD